jgi:hypothetical protein
MKSQQRFAAFVATAIIGAEQRLNFVGNDLNFAPDSRTCEESNRRISPRSAPDFDRVTLGRPDKDVILQIP